MSRPIMVTLMLKPEEIEYILMILAGLDNLHNGNRSREIRQVLGRALFETTSHKVVLEDMQDAG